MDVFLLSAIQFSLAVGHVACRDRQRPSVEFQNEERDQVSSCIGLAESGVDVLTLSVATFYEAKLWSAEEEALYFVDLDPMLPSQFLNNLVEPDEAGNPQPRDSPSVVSSSRGQSAKPTG